MTVERHDASSVYIHTPLAPEDCFSVSTSSLNQIDADSHTFTGPILGTPAGVSETFTATLEPKEGDVNLKFSYQGKTVCTASLHEAGAGCIRHLALKPKA